MIDGTTTVDGQAWLTMKAKAVDSEPLGEHSGHVTGAADDETLYTIEEVAVEIDFNGDDHERIRGGEQASGYTFFDKSL
ncbi:MAG: hypothetical protein LIP77_02220, partial [Planctomycetes bacterium]|nr:hypothetical protein [Planctomycetota bacterium]